jgi:hypothetical protein
MLSLTLFLSAGAAPQLLLGKVKVVSDPKADFSKYKTYQWFPPRVLTKTGIDEDHPAAAVLKELVAVPLAQRHMTELADGADLQIQAWVLSQTTPQVEALIVTAVPMAPGTYASIGDPIATIGRYNREGSLYLSFIDGRTKKGVWLGMATDSLPTKALSPDEIRGKLNKAVNAIFKKYPVKK